ncbi:hypothetical protein CN380_23070 [Bacillus sp. AFS017274]|nr:hypothetical protein [Bacillus sp. AFS017274]PEZ75538.1 hypothetical protein CN380_23070 [Bacillus sp. AFS017274]
MMKEVNQSLPEQIKNTPPSHPFEDYTVTFDHPAYLEVYKQNNELHIRVLENELPWFIYLFICIYQQCGVHSFSPLQKLNYNLSTEKRAPLGALFS